MEKSGVGKAAPPGDGLDFAKAGIEEALKALSTSMEGPSSGEAEARLEKYGPNALAEKRLAPF